MAIQEERERRRLSIIIKPDDIAALGGKKEDFLQEIRDWKLGINQIIVSKILGGFGLLYDGWREKLNQYGGILINFLQDTFGKQEKIDLTPSNELFVRYFLKNNKISVYIDDLDRGWEGRKEDIRRISALLNAVRDISTDNVGVYFRISLRSDVYYLVRTSDESTDKIEGLVIWQSWTNHEIFALLIKRIDSFFDKELQDRDLSKADQKELVPYLNVIMEPRFTGRGHWENAPIHRVILSLIRKRPRDLVKLCTLAGRKAGQNGRKVISTSDFEEIFEEYSQGRLQDTTNEYRSELHDIERLLLGMKPAKRYRTTKEGFIYTTDELLNKIGRIMEQGIFKFTNGTIADKKSLATFLYKKKFHYRKKRSRWMY